MDNTNLVPIDATDITITSYDSDDMVLAGQVADVYAKAVSLFQDYHNDLSDNTIVRQKHDLKLFCVYLKEANVSRDPDELYVDPEKWRGITYGLVLGFRIWLEKSGRASGSINVHLATIRKYCDLVAQSGIITNKTLRDIQAVKTKSGKKARNLDKKRKDADIPTRIGRKKAAPTELTTAQVFQLKKKTTSLSDRDHGYGQLLQARDALMMGLLFEHAFRCGEVAGLDIENFNLHEGKVTFYREKTGETETHILKKHTRIAAESYISQVKQGIGDWLPARETGPLFLGYKGKRIAKRTINARVGEFGEQMGIKNLSPHDARHHWTYDALKNGTPIDKVKSGGGWASNEMPLRYAKRGSIANDGVKISEE
jgi:integrase